MNRTRQAFLLGRELTEVTGVDATWGTSAAPQEQAKQ